jgi:CheY-like chemotaxis protein
MTANAFQEDINMSLESGMNAHLAKPIEPNILYQTLQKFILEKQK